MWSRLVSCALARRSLALRSPPGPLRDYYRAAAPRFDLPYTAAEFLAVDIETTGLDPRADAIVSIGFVPIVSGRVVLARAGHHLVRPDRPMRAEAVKIHGLTDEALAAAAPLAEALPPLLAALAGRVAVAHHAPLERAFLARACRSVYGAPLAAPWICTLALAKRRFARADAPIGEGELRLATCRARLGLPHRRAHDALSDALAAAELFLAQAALASGRAPARLRDLLT
ncbi:DNA polymerase III, epsilon subunit [uncultured Alphaproteobacteria bacterium]|uniref:DNA-directed DNA polymerase n=1 Tax=uncultured Alphaproteobacteria bacterium TaxID=91750 RepID=A0A212K859_9PROT|nr:DNA polymerase III, epsilon subunit [uncultured Alphaproteobacteria bacterium]